MGRGSLALQCRSGSGPTIGEFCNHSYHNNSCVDRSESTTESHSRIASSFEITVFVCRPSSSGCAVSKVRLIRGNALLGNGRMVSIVNWNALSLSSSVTCAEPNHSCARIPATVFSLARNTVWGTSNIFSSESGPDIRSSSVTRSSLANVLMSTSKCSPKSFRKRKLLFSISKSPKIATPPYKTHQLARDPNCRLLLSLFPQNVPMSVPQKHTDFGMSADEQRQYFFRG